MPNRSQKPCAKSGCRNLVSYPDRYCPEHKYVVVEEKKDNKRPNSNQRGYNYKWQKYRKNFLIRNPLCVECHKIGKLTPATVVDHIKPHKGDMKLFWDPLNHQALCKKHHDIKTATEDGGFGNKPRSKS